MEVNFLFIVASYSPVVKETSYLPRVINFSPVIKFELLGHADVPHSDFLDVAIEVVKKSHVI